MDIARQLDIFEDARDVVLRNVLAEAVLRGDLSAALAARAELAAQFAADRLIDPADVVIQQLRREHGCGPDAWSVADLTDARGRLESTVAAAAPLLLGNADAPAWLAQRWRFLAARAGSVSWHPERSAVHAAALYLAAGAWSEAALATESIASWRRIPQPLLWMVQARWHLEGPVAGWPLLAEAFWLAPERAAALPSRLNDRRLDALARRFALALDPDGGGWAWFPAWALIEHPPLADCLDAAQPPAGQDAAEAFRVVAALLRLERQGRHHEIVTQRRRLKSLSGDLFASYMRTR